MKPVTTMTPRPVAISIEEAECVVFRPGNQAERIRLKHETIVTKPELAKLIADFPGYTDPEGPYGGDDWATCRFTWIDADGKMMETESHMPVRHVSALKEFKLGKIHRPRTGRIAYCFTFSASFGLSQLIQHGLVPKNSILANEDERPQSSEYFDSLPTVIAH